MQINRLINMTFIDRSQFSQCAFIVRTTKDAPWQSATEPSFTFFMRVLIGWVIFGRGRIANSEWQEYQWINTALARCVASLPCFSFSSSVLPSKLKSKNSGRPSGFGKVATISKHSVSIWQFSLSHDVKALRSFLQCPHYWVDMMDGVR